MRDLRLERRLRPLRRAHDAADAAADRLPRRAPGGRVAARVAPGPVRREHGLQGHRRRRDARAAVEHDGGGLYFGDCKPLLGDGEIIGPPEVGALVTATAEPRERPRSMTWPRHRDRREALHARLRQAARVGGAAGLPRAARVARRGLRARPPPGGAADGDGRRRRASASAATTYYTAYAVTPRAVWAPYAR